GWLTPTSELDQTTMSTPTTTRTTVARRDFLRNASFALAAASIGVLNFNPTPADARAASSGIPGVERGDIMTRTTASDAPLTVVLVHGAFADASSWSGVVERLQAAGVQVTAPANPLRGIAIDSAYLASVFEQIPGPVLAVGHSYAGALISNAGSMA